MRRAGTSRLKRWRYQSLMAFAQRSRPDGVRVLGGAGAHGALGGFLHQRRGGEIGLADVQEHHRPVAARDLAGQRAAALATSIT
jgi:hypothetical protein